MLRELQILSFFLLKVFQLLLHTSYAVLEFFGCEVLSHTVYFDRETERGKAGGVGDHDPGVLDPVEHLSQPDLLHLLVKYFLE